MTIPESPKPGTLPSPALSWQADGTPFAQDFGDVYFSRAGGLAETRHVFHAGCGLPEAWSGKSRFVIGELGFGTGLNFLATVELWRRTAKAGAHLHYVAVEGYPLAPKDLAVALAPWPEIAPLAQELLRVYPEPQSGFHRLFLTGGIFLTLLCGDVADVLAQAEGEIDAWFLDGFSPEKNPALWQPRVFAEIARLSHTKNEGTQLATYSVAGNVRRGLEAAGFDVEKTPGFAGKREMLRGHFKGTGPASALQPWFATPSHRVTQRHVAIIGGGIAGAAVAHALRQRGWQSTIVDKHLSIAGEASGNRAAGLMPRLTAAPNLDGRFYAAAWPFVLKTLKGQIRGDGLLQLATDADEATRQQRLMEAQPLPDALLRRVDAQEASNISGCELPFGGLFFPQGGWVRPQEICASLAEGSDLLLGVDVKTLRFDHGVWQLGDVSGHVVLESDIVVVANALEAASFTQTNWLPLQARRGQVTYVPATPQSTDLRCVLTYGGYLTPADSGVHCLGATFDWVDVQNSESRAVIAEDHARNLADLAAVLPQMLAHADTSALSGRAGLRCTTLDHLPLAGALPDHPTFLADFADLRHGHPWARYPTAQYQPGLFTLTGLGARGMVSAPLAAEVLASIICDEPWPLERDLVTALHPARFLVRDLKRRAV